MLRSWKTRLIATVVVGLFIGIVLWLFNPPTSSPLFSVLGGVIASIVFEVTLFLVSGVDYLVNRRTVAATFGRDAFDRSFTLVYSSFGMSLPAWHVLQEKEIHHPHVAMDEIPVSGTTFPIFRVDEAVAAHDLKALVHLATCLAEYGATPTIARAADIVDSFDRSFVAFGLGASQKSRQLLEQLNPFGIESLASEGYIDLRRIADGKLLATPKKSEHLGYVIRLHPEQFPKRTWILCAGPGAAGTVAAAVYLAKHFAEINSAIATDGAKLGRRNCIVVVRADKFPESAVADPPIPLRKPVL